MFPAWPDLQRDVGVVDDGGEVLVRHRHRPAIDVERDVGAHVEQMLAGDRRRIGDRGAAGVAVDDHAGGLRHLHIGGVSEGRLEPAEAGLGEPDALLRHLVEIVLRQPGLQDHRAGMHPHSAGAEIVEAFLGRDRERLHPLGVARPAGHMHLAGGDRGGGPAMQVAFEEAHRLLPRGVVAEGVVHLGIDHAGHGGHAAGIQHHVAGLYSRRLDAADLGDQPVLHQNRIAGGDRVPPVAGDDGVEIDDCGLHGFLPDALVRPARPRPWRPAC